MKFDAYNTTYWPPTSRNPPAVDISKAMFQLRFRLFVVFLFLIMCHFVLFSTCRFKTESVFPSGMPLGVPHYCVRYEIKERFNYVKSANVTI